MNIWTALERAAAWNTIPAIEALLNSGAVMKNRRALARAAGHGRSNVVSYLLDRGAPIDEVANNPDIFEGYEVRNALCEAAFRGQPAVVELLLERGADPSIKDTEGRSALEPAEMQGHQSCLDVLNRHISLLPGK
ncbi:ankyrin repeat-containing domain protein [Aspergillus cavernicola]|uniref:Ankyrin repeat-containing domain protein n=1 Tax=Aspergillus cavernicola TaxID=176166 RepID=A0ABR4IW39_9EURO